jgi:uncharacterized membrane protein (DUF2068 family)
MKEKQLHRGVKAVALLGLSKGVAALVVCFGLFTLSGDSIAHLIAQFASDVRLGPNNPYVNKLIERARQVTPGNLELVITIGVIYALIRFVEAFGLWYRYHWTEWFAFLSSTIYIPFELYQCVTAPSLFSFSILIINLIIVTTLYAVINKNKRRFRVARCTIER